MWGHLLYFTWHHPRDSDETPGEVPGLLRKRACEVSTLGPFQGRKLWAKDKITSLFPSNVGHLLCPTLINTGKDIGKGPPGFSGAISGE